jgi:septum formation protein
LDFNQAVSSSKHAPLILASTSVYRKGLLEKLNLPFEVLAPRVDETPRPNESPQRLAVRLAREKALAVAGSVCQGLVIGSDQVATLGRERLGKPGTRDKAIAQLRKASGRMVLFNTAVCVAEAGSGTIRWDHDVTRVLFRELTLRQIEAYVDREEPLDCAGSFKSEGLGIVLFERIETEDPNALVGLPLIRLVTLLKSFGVDLPRVPKPQR